LNLFITKKLSFFVVFALEGVTVCSYQINKNNRNAILRFFRF